MRKRIRKLFITFTVLICIFALVGCDLIFVDNPEPEKNPAEESGSNEESNNEETFKDIFVPDEELIPKLLEYLSFVVPDVDGLPTSFKAKIDRIKKGEQPLQVVFDSKSDYYFVCAYFNADHNELFKCCCAEEYIWVGFKNSEDIPEYYNGEKFLVAFQINEASFIADIVSNERDIPEVGNFKQYVPVFEDGLNINPPIVFEDRFVYLNTSDNRTLYFSTDFWSHYWYHLDYVHLDGRDYFSIHLYYTQSFDEERVDEKLEYQLGEYYDQLIDIMIEHKYNDETNLICGLFEIDELVNRIFN